MGSNNRNVLRNGNFRAVCMVGVCTMSDFVMPLENMPDGHIEDRLSELLLLIHEDEVHLLYLKTMYSQFWTEKARRTLKARPDE
jgi:hypothetical protein